jgi:hypothetical protein
MQPKDPEARVKRRLYSLYKEQIVKLEEMSKARSIPQSQFLRELIDVAYVTYKQTLTRYDPTTP